MGSFIPPLYYGFYCSRVLKIVYICLICSLGIICIIVSLWDKFNAPEYRLLRAGKVFIFSLQHLRTKVFLGVVLQSFPRLQNFLGNVISFAARLLLKKAERPVKDVIFSGRIYFS